MIEPLTYNPDIKFTTTNFRASNWTVLKLTVCLAVLLTVFQQFPVIRETFYDQIRLSLYGIFGGVSLYCFLRFPFGEMPSLGRFFALNLIATFSILLLLHLVNGGAEGTVSYFEIVEQLVPFGILITSLFIPFSKRQIIIFIFLYSLFVSIMGISLVIYYGGTWAISSQYLLKGKNLVGPILAVSTLAMSLLLVKEKQTLPFFVRIIGLLATGSLFSSLVVLRNRSGLLALLAVLSFWGLKNLFSRKMIESIVILLVVFIGIAVLAISGHLVEIIQPVSQPVIDAFTLNYQIGDIESLSAGRWSVYMDSFKHLGENLFFGDVFSLDKFPRIPHNYILNKWVKYGIFGSLPMVLFYLYLWFFAIKETILTSNRRGSFISMAPYILLIPMITSLLEYTHPFGPGVSQIMVWFLLGQYLRNGHKNKGELV